MHSFAQNVLVKTSFNNLVLANSTQNGTGVDTQAFRRCGFIFTAATGAATTANFQLQDSPDNTTWTNISGATLGTAVAASTSTEYLVDIDLAKRQRYLRAQLIGTGTAGNCTGTFALFEAQVAAVTQDNTAIEV